VYRFYAVTGQEIHPPGGKVHVNKDFHASARGSWLPPFLPSFTYSKLAVNLAAHAVNDGSNSRTGNSNSLGDKELFSELKELFSELKSSFRD
jgi:hypothetical protein